MSKNARIVVTRPLLDATRAALHRLGQVDFVGAAHLREGQELAARADVLVSFLSDPVDEPLLRQMPRLRLVANYAVGFNNVDVEAAERLGIYVSNTPDVLTESTADLAFALMLAAARRMGEGERMIRQGAFCGWSLDLLLGSDVHHKTLGVVGYGRIGRAVARRARGFGMRVLFCTAHSKKAQLMRGDEQVTLERLLAESDFVSLHVPLTEATHHLIDADALQRMQRHAVLINTARGPVVDEEALVEALANGRIGAAGLDVFEREPDVHPRLLELQNVVLLPHIGSATRDTRLAMGEIVLAAIRAVLAGRRPPCAVNAPASPRQVGAS